MGQIMTCKHDAAEQDTASHFDGLCPLCLRADNERLRKAIQEYLKPNHRITLNEKLMILRDALNPPEKGSG
jgi:hypothetical protein